jgi:phage terminase small subunit
MSIKKLTNKQDLFLTNYLVGMTGTDAAMQAYNVKNRRTAAVIASQNLKRLNIAILVKAYFCKE